MSLRSIIAEEGLKGKTAMNYTPNVYQLMQKAHDMIIDAYPGITDDEVLAVVAPWFAGTLTSSAIPKKPFARDGQKALMKALRLR